VCTYQDCKVRLQAARGADDAHRERKERCVMAMAMPPVLLPTKKQAGRGWSENLAVGRWMVSWLVGRSVGR
jgi:hypothetical protein